MELRNNLGGIVKPLVGRGKRTCTLDFIMTTIKEHLKTLKNLRECMLRGAERVVSLNRDRYICSLKILKQMNPEQYMLPQDARMVSSQGFPLGKDDRK